MNAAPIRWTIGLAAGELGCDRRTLAERIKTSGGVPGEDGKFSTRQIFTALHGDLAGEKLRLVRAQADLAEAEAREKQKTSIPREVFFPVLEQVHGTVATIIRRSPLPPRERDEILTELRGVPATLWSKGYKPADTGLQPESHEENPQS